MTASAPKNPALITVLNLNGLMNLAPMQSVMDAMPAIRDAAAAAKLAKQAEAAVADVQAYTETVAAELAIAGNLLSTVIDVLVQTFDISYHQLILKQPTLGGLDGYLGQFNANLLNPADQKRPYDDGGAAMAAVYLFVTAQNPAQAAQNIQAFIDLFTNADALRKDALKALTGSVGFNDMAEEFWGHYRKKKIAGTHAETQGNWQKYSVGDMIPIADPLKDWLDSVVAKSLPKPSFYGLSARVGVVFDKIIDFIEAILVVWDTFRKLLLDTSATIIITPIVTGCTDQYGNVFPAHEALSFYSQSLPEQIRSRTIKDALGGAIGAEYDAILRYDQYTAGMAIVLKVPSVEVCAQQMNLLLKIFGVSVSLGVESQANEIAFGS